MTNRLIVSVKEGKVRGIKRTSEYSGAEYYSFFGVPYGQPPVGSLRFKDPSEVKPWKDIYDATVEKPGCAQFSLKLYQFTGTEDCLFNNIHTPELPTKSTPLRPVIAIIHPGGYLHGSPNENEYGSTAFFIHHDIVYVGIAHRLHIFGFLNFGIEECSGNQGLKDIILSLRWLKKNISCFGGDPENITLIGVSCGATTIHALMVSPVSKGLFHKAVILGAHLFDPTIPFENANEHVAFQLARFLGYKGNLEDKKKLLLFFKKINPMQLVTGQRQFLVKEYRQDIAPILPSGLFIPTIDHGENAVLPEFPRNLIPSTSRIPFMIGYGERESALGFARGGSLESTKKNFKTTIRQNAWGWGRDLTDDDIEKINEQVESFYLEGKSIKHASLSKMIDIQTGAMISDVYDTLINVVSPEASVYAYKFQFEGDIRTVKNSFINLYDERLPGTFHGDDACYWSRMSDPLSSRSKEMVDTYTKIITTFARNGDPNFEELQVHWRPTKPDSPCYLNINNQIQMIDSRLHDEKLVFWDKIKKEFGNSDDAKVSKSV
ncbi:esterase E4-like [Planococcus citri]|uniref:esterase E4-like n=1 Tax=Planococcus citri TaxID=170843 RepID=UPI0031F81EB6